MKICLSGYDFFRIHKSYLVNLREIQKYIRGEGGHLIMSNGATLNVSKQRKGDFLAYLFRFIEPFTLLFSFLLPFLNPNTSFVNSCFDQNS